MDARALRNPVFSIIIRPCNCVTPNYASRERASALLARGSKRNYLTVGEPRAAARCQDERITCFITDNIHGHTRTRSLLVVASVGRKARPLESYYASENVYARERRLQCSVEIYPSAAIAIHVPSYRPWSLVRLAFSWSPPIFVISFSSRDIEYLSPIPPTVVGIFS